MALRRDLIEKSLEVEELTRVFYEKLKAKLPEHAGLCDELMEGEQKHKRIIEEGAKMIVAGDAPDELIFPSMKILKRTCDTIKAITMEIETVGADYHRACEMALKVEESTGEGYLQSAIKFAKSQALHDLFRRVGQDERTHKEIILDYMKSKGLAK